MLTTLKPTNDSRWKRCHLLLAVSLLALSTIAATPPPDVQPESGGGIAPALWHCFLFGLLGILMVVIGFKFFDCLIRKVDIEAEVAKGNIAAAILGAAVVLGISIIVAAAIH